MAYRWQNVADATGLTDANGSPRPTIFAEMSALASHHNAMNLGQGFPDADGPEWIRALASDAIFQGENQYPPGRGNPKLLSAVAEHQSRHYDITLDPGTEILITAGATEAIAAAVLAFAGAGDEVITLEPFYDSHAASIAMAGATHVTVPLMPTEDGFRLDRAALASAVTPRTRIILINTPHNPTGTVLTRDELEAIAAEAVRVDALVVTDEVYEHLRFDDHEHVPIATLPGMASRTLTISSAGKTFSLTGWKIGWISGPAHLISAVATIKQFLTYSGGAPFQPAIAQALIEGDADVATLRQSLASRRDVLMDALSDVGFGLTVPHGTYFVCADATPFLTPERPNGDAFARWLPEAIGVACIPVSAFCIEGSATADALTSWVRFTFVKEEATLHEAIRRLGALKN